MKIVVVGGGIAGASAAYHLAGHSRSPDVTLVEAEAQLARHTTGRSAAQLILNYGEAPVRALTVASLPFLITPPEDLVDHRLLSPRSLLTVATEAQSPTLDRALAEGRAMDPSITEISMEEAVRRFPPLRPDRFIRAMLEPESSDIDVAGLHQAMIRGFRARGGAIAVSTRVDAARWRAGRGDWEIETTKGVLSADVVVDCAGAWGDVVAERAEVAPIGLAPLRRTAFTVASRWTDSQQWPLVADVDHSWYVKPDGSQFLCSPADEQPSEPCDAKAEEIDVALAIDRINDATSLEIRSVSSTWAGLRTFAPDRSMIIGPDPDRPQFVWCVGQGGTGIQTAPGAGRLTCDLLLDGEPGSAFDHCDLDLRRLLPDRFR